MGRGDPARDGPGAALLPLAPSVLLPATTYRVSELAEEIASVLGDAFGSLWVTGEIQRARPSQRGHLYFELIEKAEDDSIRAKLDAVIWRTDHERVRSVLAASGQRLTEGLEVRVRAQVDFYPPGGRLQLVVREVDPAFSLGQLERRRREILAELVASGLAERNRALPLPELPLSIALVTSQGSAAYHDFLSTLAESGYGFRVLLLHTAVQGKGAEREIASALAALEGLPIDCTVLIRGGGSRSDLAAFDTREVALAVAQARVPVLTGLGHEIDQSIADRVAHTAAKTPTKVAELLVARVAEAELGLERAELGLARAAERPLLTARERLARVERRLALAREPLARAAAEIDALARGLASLARLRLRAAGERSRDLPRRLELAAVRLLGRVRDQPESLGGRIATASRGQLRAAGRELDGRERLVAQLGPARTLARGFSITRNARGGLVRAPSDTQAGEILSTETAGGTLTSRVETP
jgi:exodeoxyribonuclease VII large subunit